jgi:NAD(P)H dehydrogenase (quinone)
LQPVHVLIVHAHPEPRSFSSALACRAQQVVRDMGHTVEISDLYGMGFDPVSSRANFTSVRNPDYLKPQLEERHASEVGGFAPDVRAEMDKVARADFLLLNFPLWWFSMPAIMKGWVDRVFAMGFAYGGGRIYETGVFRGKRGMLSITTGGAEGSYLPDGRNGDLNVHLFHVHHGMLWFCGIEVLPPFVAWAVAHSDAASRQRYLAAFEARLRAIDSTPPMKLR